MADLSAHVLEVAGQVGADGILVFDTDGVTGHLDHAAATAAALAAADLCGLPVLGWTVPRAVAAALNEQYGAAFTGHQPGDIDLVVTFDRTRQLAAARCHPSQAIPGSLLWRRLELLGDIENPRWLNHPKPNPTQPILNPQKDSTSS